MASFPSMKISIFFALFLSHTTAFISQAAVPQNQTFRFVVNDDFGPYISEYDASYIVLDIFASPFQFAFYNTTPNAFYLALRMGLRRSEAVFDWVWEANRGNPVRQNATFSFGTDGNLVLADADGRIAWQTHTANKGVVGYRLLSNGNLVLYDSKGSFIWQSFDYPTDTLLVGQSLKAGGPSKLVSRVSEKENADGPYSLVLEPKGFALYYTSKNSPRPILYWFSKWFYVPQGSLQNVTLTSDPESFELVLDYYYLANYSSFGGNSYIANPVNNSTLTYLRLGIDGNIRLYTYFVNVRQGVWRKTYTLFDRDSGEGECQWPEKCGQFGLCEDNQCVACPLSQGLVGWSRGCKAKAVTSCRASDFHYYKLEGVELYMSKYTRGERVSKSGCESKCTKDCKCLGYFYKKDVSRCWVAYDLRTLTKVGNSSHSGYIKEPNH